MHEDHRQAGSAFLTGFAVGLAGGAMAGLLLAPSSGQKARTYVADQARKGKARVLSAAERGRTLLQQGRDALEHSREVVSTAIDEGRETYRRIASETV